MTKEDRQFGGRAPRFRVEASPALRLRTSAGEQELRWMYCSEGPAALLNPQAAAGQGRHTPEIPGRQEAGDGRGGASFKLPHGSSGWKDLRGLIMSTLGTRWGFEEVSGSKEMESRSQHLQISRSQESSLIYNLRLRRLGTEVRN